MITLAIIAAKEFAGAGRHPTPAEIFNLIDDILLLACTRKSNLGVVVSTTFGDDTHEHFSQ